MSTPATSYAVVYHLEIGLLFAALVAIGPLARYAPSASPETSRFGLADLPA
jgi:BCD family chlorophyll transporter-like MFS transporter